MGNIHSAVLERATRVQETSEEEMRTLGYAVREELRNLAEDPSKRTLYKLLHTDNRPEINQGIGPESRLQPQARPTSNPAPQDAPPLGMQHLSGSPAPLDAPPLKKPRLSPSPASQEAPPSVSSSASSSSLKADTPPEGPSPTGSPRLIIDETMSEPRAVSPSSTKSAESGQARGSGEDEGPRKDAASYEELFRPRVSSMGQQQHMHPKKKFLEGYRNRSNTVSLASLKRPAPEAAEPPSGMGDDFRHRTQSVSALHSLKKRAIAEEKAKNQGGKDDVKTLNIRTCINAILESQMVRNKLMSPLEEEEQMGPARSEPSQARSEEGAPKDAKAMGEMGIHGPLLMLAAQVDSMVPLPVSKEDGGPAESKGADDPPQKYEAERGPRVATIRPITQPARPVPTSQQASIEVRNPFEDAKPLREAPSMPALVPHPQMAPKGDSRLEDKVRLYEMTHRHLLSQEIQKVYAQDFDPRLVRPERDCEDSPKDWAYHPQTAQEREDIIRESRHLLTSYPPSADDKSRKSSASFKPARSVVDAPLDLSAKSQDVGGACRSYPPREGSSPKVPPEPKMFAPPLRSSMMYPPAVPGRSPVPPLPSTSQAEDASRTQPPTSVSGGAARVTVGNLLGDHPPSDILYLRCNVCDSTYGSLHSFRKHFSKAHGHDPNAEHITIQTISATRDAIDKVSRLEPIAEEEKQQALQQLNLLPSNQYYESQLSRYKTGGREGSPPALSPPHFPPRSDAPNLHRHSPVAPPTERRSPSFSSHAPSEPHLTAEPRSLECPQCGLEFPTRDWGSFTRHVRSHESGAQEAKCCPSESPLRGGEARAAPSFKCRFCEARFEQTEALNRHQQQHLVEGGGGQYRCHFCPKSFVHESGLIVHMNEHAAEIHRTSRSSKVPSAAAAAAYSRPEAVPSSAGVATMYARRMSFTESTHRDFKRPAAASGLDEALDHAKRPRSGSFPNALDLFERKIDTEHRRTLGGSKEHMLWQQQRQHLEAAARQQQMSRARAEEKAPPPPQTARSVIDEMVEAAVSELGSNPSHGPPQKILPRLFKGDPMEKVWMLEGKEGEESSKQTDSVKNMIESFMSREMARKPEKTEGKADKSEEWRTSQEAPQKPAAREASDAVKETLSQAIEKSISYHLRQEDQSVSRLRQLMSEKPVFNSERDGGLTSGRPLTSSQHGSQESSDGQGLQSMRQICDQIIAKSLSNYDSATPVPSGESATKSESKSPVASPLPVKRHSSRDSPAADLPQDRDALTHRHPKSWDPRFKSLELAASSSSTQMNPPTSSPSPASLRTPSMTSPSPVTSDPSQRRPSGEARPPSASRAEEPQNGEDCLPQKLL